MNKKLILILICLTSFGTAFAQRDFTDSAKSKATAGTIKSDSDNLNANDIFDVERTFFSAGYQPSLNLGNTGTSGSSGTMTGFWAMPINDTMTIGIAGEYNMESTRDDFSSLTSTGGSLPPATVGGIGSSIVLTENSSFNIRPVFKFGVFAFSYRIARSNTYTSTEKKVTLIPSGTEVYTDKISNSDTMWEHEIGFAWNTDLFKLYIPIGALIDMGLDSTTTHDKRETPGNIEDILNKTDNTIASLYINPEITFPVEIGPITEFEAGIDFKIGIFAPYSIDNLTTYSGTDYEGTPPPPASLIEKKSVTKTEGQSSIEVGTYLQTTMEWDTWEDKITFIAKPTIGINYQHANPGDKTKTDTDKYVKSDENTETVVNSSKSTYYDAVTPYLEANIGSAIRFTEWFELRAGLHYKLNWNNTTTTTSYKLQEGGKISTLKSTFDSTFEIYSGFGFILGEDFFIDVYISAGNVQNDNAFETADLGATDAYDLFDIRNYGVQLSYRF